MSINPEFKPIDEFYKNENKPLSAPDLPVEAFRDEPGSLMIAQPATKIIPSEPEEKAGYFERLGNAFLDYNEFAQAGRFLSREFEFLHPAEDDVPDDFNPRAFEHLKDYPPNYWDFISDAKSPNEIAARQQFVLEEIQKKEYFQTGGWTAELLGGFTGAIFSPSSYLLFPAMIKYASVAENVIKNTVKAAPAIAAQTVAHEGFIEATEAGGNLEDFAINSLRDAAFGVAFLAGGAGLGAAYRGGKLWNSRKVVNLISDGIDVNPVLNEATGEVTGFKAQAAPGFSVSAAKVEQAQSFVDSAMHNGFLFGIPGVYKIAGNKINGSPIVQGLSNRFATIREFTDRMASHSILTQRILKGEAKAESAEDILSFYNAGAVNFGLNYRSHFYEENGIIGGANVTNAVKALKQRALKGMTETEESFNWKVVDAVLSQDFKYSKNINAAAKYYTDFTDAVYRDFREAMGFSEEFLSPATARGYYTQNMNHMELTKRPEIFRQIVADEYKRQDEVLEQIFLPLKKAEDFLRQLEEHKLSKDSLDRSLVEEINAAKAAVRQEKLKIEELARNDEDVAILLEDRNFIKLEDAEILRNILEPLTNADNKVAQKKLNIAKLKSRLSKHKSNAIKAKTEKAKLRNVDAMQKLEAKIGKAERELNELIKIRDDVKFNLDKQALDGKIQKNFFTRDGNIVYFRDPNEWAKFRKPFQNDQERSQAAEALRQTYLNETPEQVKKIILGTLMPSVFANPLKKRTVMVPSRVFHEARFLDADVAKSVTAYTRTLAKHIALKKVFGDISIKEGESGLEGMARVLSEERASMEKEIDKIKDEKTRQKERIKLQRDFAKAQKFMKQMLDSFMGHTNASQGHVRFARAVRNFAASTKLGGVPISQITDVGATILKHGLWPFLRDGLKPFIQTLNGYMGTEKAEALRKNAAHALLALEHVADGYTKKFFDSGSVGEVPIATHLESALDNIAHLSGNFYGTNFIENANQRIVANIMQSQIMEDMYNFKAGNLSKKRHEALLQYGLDPKKWADRFIKNFEEAGGWKESYGGYQSKYWAWKDDAAVSRMAMTLRRGVYDTIVQRGLFTSPFWTNNPLPGMITLFHGWAFSAFTRYTVPMMQRMDAQKLLGIVFMLGLGAMTDPLRKIANGKKADVEDDSTWFGHAFTVVSNSGVLGHTTDMLQTANKLLGNQLLPEMTVRYQGMNQFGALLGPAAGIAQDLMYIGQDFLSGKINQGDARRMARLTPLTGMLGIRGLLNNYIDSLDIPETRKDAEGWSWRQ